MTILHTADWHLGHRLYDRDRTDEHRAALAWLLDTIVREKVELLIVAGDVFDVSNPSNQARELYYDFLGKLIRTDCAAAVIVGGNHDSPAMLDAPSGLLQSLRLHVVGAARQPSDHRAGTQVQEEVFKIEVGAAGSPAVIVAAVPYLRERDVRKGTFGEAADDRMAAIRNGIREHYRLAGEAAEALRTDPATPMVVTGHLFASGAEDNDEKKSHIYQADQDNIEAGQFPGCFDYVALGHVHRAQSVDNKPYIRYSGSLIPLTFVEGQRPRSVRLVTLGRAGEEVVSRKIEVPYARDLFRIHGELEAVKEELRTRTAQALAARYDSETAGEQETDATTQPTSSVLTPWVEIRIKTDERIPHLRQTLLDVITEVTGDDGRGLPLELIRISTERLSPAPAAAPLSARQLGELEPEEVFNRLLDGNGTPVATAKELISDFRELRNWMEDG